MFLPYSVVLHNKIRRNSELSSQDTTGPSEETICINSFVNNIRPTISLNPVLTAFACKDINMALDHE